MNNDSFADVKAATKLITEAGIISALQLDSFLEKRGLNKNRVNSVKKILINQNYAFTDTSEAYFSCNPNVNYMKFTEQLKKAVWLFIDSIPSMNYANFNCKIPSIGYLCNDSYENINDINDVTLFYISKGSEDISSRIINTNFGDETSAINSIIIIDSPEQIEKIKVNKPINIVSYAVISNTGEVTYY